MKRFYSEVTYDKTEEGYRILLDGRPVKTPSKKELLAPTIKIAQAVTEEWQAQTDVINPQTMPLTQILNTKQDRIGKERKAIEIYVMKYLHSDLLCYRADFPPKLVQKQMQLWQPWLDWFERKYGSALLITNGLKALQQDQTTFQKIEAEVRALDDLKFTLFQLVVSVSGSIVIGLAFIHGAVTPEEIFEVTFLEEHFKDGIYNAEKYGQDPSQEKQQLSAMVDLKASMFILQNC